VAIPDIEHPLLAARVLRSIGFDTAIDLQGLLHSSLFAFLSGARVRIGYRSLKEAAFLFYNVRTLPPVRGQHVVEGYLRFAALLGAPTRPVEFLIATKEEQERRVEALLSEAGVSKREKLVAIAPGSSWRAKSWPAERLAGVAEHISSRLGCLPVIVGSGGDILRAEAVLANCRSPLVNLAGKTSLKELAVLLRRCLAFVGNDSGPAHLAAAVGKPVVAVYGPTDPARVGPYGDHHITIVAAVACRPCRRHSRAEGCSHLRCLTEVSPVQVCEAVERVLFQALEGGASEAEAHLAR